MVALKGLDAGFFISRDEMNTLLPESGCLLVERADSLNVGVKRLRIQGALVSEPIPPPVRL